MNSRISKTTDLAAATPLRVEPVSPFDTKVRQLTRQRKSALGQFLTPEPVAELMASLFDARWNELQLLDAGAGAGALTAALVQRLCMGPSRPKRISVTTYEIDPELIEPLSLTLSQCKQNCERAGISFSSVVLNEDFIAAAVAVAREDLFTPQPQSFNAAIVNPPYRKIRSDSAIRLLLRSAGIETSNLYAAFVALITKLLVNEGELVAITPRSFCNGPYFKPFREDFLEGMSLRHLHVFESRSKAFSHDDVLQENVIFHALKSESKPRRVTISISSGAAGGPVTGHEVDYRQIVSPDDPEQFIHVSVDDKQTKAKLAMGQLPATLGDLDVSISTGRVVEFRAEPYLRQWPNEETAPLIYPCHFNNGFVQWPKSNSRKPNAIVSNKLTQNLLVPSGFYVLVKRITAKEEKRRVVACIYDPERIHAAWIAFENHLNYFHVRGHGLPVSLAKGLAAFLNSTIVDIYFRQFSGHTQVNATDLRKLNYPSKSVLERLGNKVDDPLCRSDLDSLVEKELF